MVLPLLTSRNEPLINKSRRPELCYGFIDRDIDFELKIESGKLMLNLKLVGKKVATMTLDFLTCREALACKNQHSGFTETGAIAGPRIERSRSQLLSRTAIETAKIEVETAVVQQQEVIELHPH